MIQLLNVVSNIDRVIAIWQRLNPAETTFSQNLGQATFTDPLGYTQTETTPLLPFMRNSTGAPPATTHYWTSLDCQNTNNLGYVYPETNLSAPDLRAYINRQYLWLTAGVDRPADRRPPSSDSSGFPVDFGPRHVNAPCLPRTVFVDGGGAFPSPYLREPHAVVRAVRSIDPEVSGVPVHERRTVDAPGADSQEEVPSTSFAAVVNTNSIRQWYALAQFEK